jgi:hypothetical protein
MNRLNLDVVFQLTPRKSSNNTSEKITIVDYEALERQINRMPTFSEANVVISKIMKTL